MDARRTLIRLAAVPALPVAAGLVAGILMYAGGLPVWAAVAVGALGTVAMALRVPVAGPLLLAAALGWLTAMLNAPVRAPEAVFDGRERVYAGRLTGLSVTPHAERMLINVDSVGGTAVTPFVMQLTMLPDGGGSLVVGDYLQFPAIPEPADAPVLFPHQPDMTAYRCEHGIAAEAFIRGDSLRVTGRADDLAARTALYRRDLLHRLARCGLTDGAFGMLAALLVAERDWLPPQMNERFRAAGIAHALALSGFHVGVIALIAGALTWPLRLWRRARVWRFAAVILLLWLYAVFTGPGLSVVRATLMLTVFLTAAALGGRALSWNSLFVAVALIVAVSPYSIYSAGLQLSVAAVCGILAFAEVFRPMSGGHWAVRLITWTVFVSVAAILATSVVTVLYFHRLPLWFIPANLLITFLLPLIMLAGLLLLLLAWVGFMPHVAVKAVNGLCTLADGGADLLSGGIESLYLSPLTALLCVLTVAALAVALRHRGLPARIALTLTAVAAVSAGYVTAEDVPTAEAIVVSDTGNTALVLRQGAHAVAVMSADSLHAEGALRRINTACRHYLDTRRADTVRAAAREFSRGSFARRGDVIALGRTVVTMPRGVRPDSIGLPVQYALLTSRYRGTVHSLVSAQQPDTLVLGRDLSRARALEYLRQARGAGIPVIDLRRQPWSPFRGEKN